MPERPNAPTAPELLLETESGSTVMTPGRDYHVGRDPLSDIVIDDARVSWHHAVLRPDAGHWTLEDEHSTNGTYADGRRVHEWGVGPGSVIRFGNPADGPCVTLADRPPRPRNAPRPCPCPPSPAPSGNRPPYDRCPAVPSASAGPATTTSSSTT
jgi:hypothetical protein